MNVNVISLKHVDPTNKDEVGGKGANLGDLMSVDIDVPQGFVITTSAYRTFIEETGLNLVLGKFTEKVQDADPKELNYIGTRIKQIISATPWPTNLGTELKGVSKAFDVNQWAIRSSAVDEDSGNFSFAGQHSTFLGIVGTDNYLRRVKDVFASLFEPRAMSYRVKQGLGIEEAEIAVVVQELIDPLFSGVMFTQDPNTGENKTIIETISGLGEALVSGNLTPNHYEIENEEPYAITNKELHKQSKKLMAGYNGKPEWVETYGNTDVWVDTIQSIASIGRQIAKHYGKPQDIEFVITNSGQVKIVQARPITTGGKNVNGPLGIPILVKGAATSFGLGVGPVRHIKDVSELDQVEKGDIVVTEMTTPDFVPIFDKIAGLVTSLGGATCHAAIVSREFNLPCVVGVGSTEKLLNGYPVTVDGSNGLVYSGVTAESFEETQ